MQAITKRIVSGSSMTLGYQLCLALLVVLVVIASAEVAAFVSIQKELKIHRANEPTLRIAMTIHRWAGEYREDEGVYPTLQRLLACPALQGGSVERIALMKGEGCIPASNSVVYQKLDCGKRFVIYPIGVMGDTLATLTRESSVNNIVGCNAYCHAEFLPKRE
ncbi:MAG: hypothetical protein V1907_01430 [Candidatus Kerfeldbacteria bacterium]